MICWHLDTSPLGERTEPCLTSADQMNQTSWPRLNLSTSALVWARRRRSSTEISRNMAAVISRELPTIRSHTATGHVATVIATLPLLT